MRYALAVLVVSFLTHGSSTFGADAGGNYAVWGIGQASCHQFTKAYAQHALQNYTHYLAGYLTAFNTLTDGVYQATGKNTATANLALLNTHCSENPMHSFERAVQSLLIAVKAADQAAAKHKKATWGRPPVDQSGP